MANTKRQKKYDPRRRSPERGMEAIYRSMTLADTRRLSMIQQLQVVTSARMAVSDCAKEYCPAQFNMLSNLYRISKAIAAPEGLNLPAFAAVCDAAWQSLMAYYESELEGAIPPDLLRPVNVMIDHLVSILECVPLSMYEVAARASEQALFKGVFSHFKDKTEPWEWEAALAVMDGAKAGKLVERFGQSEVRIANAARVVGAMTYTLHADRLLDFPSDMAKLRKIGPTLRPTLEQMIKTAMEFEQAA